MSRLFSWFWQETIWRQPVANLDESAAVTEFLRQLVAQIPWGHHRLIFKKINATEYKPESLVQAVKRNSSPISRRLHVSVIERGGQSFEITICDLKKGPRRRFRSMLMQRTGAERLKMGCSMHATVGGNLDDHR